MSSAMALESDVMWLHAPNYEVAALNPKLAGRLTQLKHALQTGVAVSPDVSRNSFYDVELADGWAYIHVRDDKHTVYLVAYSRL